MKFTIAFEVPKNASKEELQAEFEEAIDEQGCMDGSVLDGAYILEIQEHDEKDLTAS